MRLKFTICFVWIFYGLHCDKFNLNQTYFPSLLNTQKKATRVNDDKYKWVAKVVLSQTNNFPYLCNAICIKPRIFITAARCITGTSTYYSKVIYNNLRLSTKAHVVPSAPTKQGYDDIGFIVTMDTTTVWHTIDLENITNRTDDNYQWLVDLKPPILRDTHKVVAFAPEFVYNYAANILNFSTCINLYELNVVIGLGMCKNIFSMQKQISGFYVPCYHSCNLKDFERHADTCNRYLGVEGGAVIHKDKSTLLGIATWGAYFSKITLPVGFTMANSVNFWKNYECAMIIRNYTDSEEFEGVYQHICDEFDGY